MTDVHIRILRVIAQQRRRELSGAATESAGQADSASRRQRRLRAVQKSATQVAQAEARRRPRSALEPGC